MQRWTWWFGLLLGGLLVAAILPTMWTLVVPVLLVALVVMTIVRATR